MNIVPWMAAAAIRPVFGTGGIIVSPPVPVGRATISGATIYDRFGNPFIPMGFNYGHNDLYTNAGGPGGSYITADPAEDVTMGANSVRIIPRARNGDSEGVDGDPTGSGTFDESYLTSIIDPVVYGADAAGLAIDLALDSNCDVNCHSETQCFFDGSSTVQNVYNNSTLRARFLARSVKLAQRYLGKITFYEGGVEPALGLAPGAATNTAIQDFQEEFFDAILAVDPGALFIFGGRAYGSGAVKNAFRASWATKYPNKLIMTCDFLSGAIYNDFPTKLKQLTDCRADRGIPVISQQFGIVTNDPGNAQDPDDSLTISAAAQMKTQGVGLIYWEKVTPGADAFGCYYVSGGARIKKTLRYTTVSNIFKAVTQP